MGQIIGHIYIYKDTAFMREDINGATNYYKNPNDGQKWWRPCGRSEYDIAVSLGKRAPKDLVPWMRPGKEKHTLLSREEILGKVERLFAGRITK